MAEAYSSSSATTPTKRACDACHRRKVKCITARISDPTRPCKNCASAGLVCTYNAVPQKKGPKGSRAKIISELRETQHHPSPIDQDHVAQGLVPGMAALGLTPGLLSPGLTAICVDFFYSNLHTSQPVLHRAMLMDIVARMGDDAAAYCLVSSLCAYVLVKSNLELPPSAMPEIGYDKSSQLLAEGLLEEASRVRRAFDYRERPSILSICTSFFLFGSHFCLDRDNTAWFHLREATTLAYNIGMHDENAYAQLTPIDAEIRRRLYWLLFVTERSYALQRHRPLSLYGNISLPSFDGTGPDTADLNGFLHLIALFRPFDDTFIGFWNKTRSDCTADWLIDMQNQLSAALPGYVKGTEPLAVDLRVSQLWLKTMIWQLSIGQGFLSSQASDQSMTFQYPIDLSRDLASAALNYSPSAMEMHGIGIVEKIFDIACTLIDIMACLPEQQIPTSPDVGPRAYLQQLVALVSKLRGGRKRFLPLLISKIHDSLPSSLHTTVYPEAPQSTTPLQQQQQQQQQRPASFLDYKYDSSGHSSHVNSPFDSPAASTTALTGPVLVVGGNAINGAAGPGPGSPYDLYAPPPPPPQPQPQPPHTSAANVYQDHQLMMVNGAQNPAGNLSHGNFYS